MARRNKSEATDLGGTITHTFPRFDYVWQTEFIIAFSAKAFPPMRR